MAPGRERQEQAQPAAFRLVAADELGLLKVIEVPAGPKWEEASVVAKWGEPSRSNGVTALCSAAASQDPGTASLLAVGRTSGCVQLLDGTSGAQVASWQLAAAAGALSKAVGLHFLGVPPATGGTEGVSVLSVSSSGRVTLHKAASGGGDPSFEEEAAFQAAQSIAATAVSPGRAVLAVGGEGCQLSLWDIATRTRAWQAKGAKPNAIGLVDPANITAATFVSNYPPSARGGGGDDGGGACSVGRQVVVVGNAAHKLLLYDTAAGRRPQLEVAWRDARVTALAADDSGRRVWAANGAGAVEALDLRAGRMSGTLKGAAGSVRALALNPWGQPLIASAGLDRFVRVHNAETRANLGRAYIKQQLTGVAWLPPLAPAPVAATAEAPASGKKSKRKHHQQQQQEEEEDSDEEEEDRDEEDDSSEADTSSDSSGSDGEGAGRSARHRGNRSVPAGGDSGGKRKHRGGIGGKAKHGGKKRR